jgi:hypothetical protein
MLDAVLTIMNIMLHLFTTSILIPSAEEFKNCYTQHWRYIHYRLLIRARHREGVELASTHIPK